MTLTPQSTLGMWLLTVLRDNNGRASKWLALRLMEQAYGHLLTAKDRDIRASVNEAAWENNTAWQRNSLVEAGLLQATEQSGRGVWALTEAGRKAAAAGEASLEHPGPARRKVEVPSAASDDPADEVAIHVEYQGQRVEASFAPGSHRVAFHEGPLRGQQFKSPSGAARAVVATLNPGVNPNRNGWVFWTVTRSGNLLEELRQA